jgi:hypothetical protein
VVVILPPASCQLLHGCLLLVMVMGMVWRPGSHRRRRQN